MAAEPTPISAPDAQALLQALTRIKNGNFFYDDLPTGGEGTYGEITATLKELVDLLNVFAGETTRLAREIGWEGKYGGQEEVPAAQGSWRDLVDNLNHMSYHLTLQVRDFANVTRAYTEGDFSRRATARCDGETLGLQQALNQVGQRLQAD